MKVPRWKVALFLLGGLILLLGWLLLDLLVDAGTFKTIEPHFAGRCVPVDGVMGSEDIVFDSETKRAYISFQDFRSMRRVGEEPEPGYIVAYDVERGVRPVKVAMDLTEPFHPHGLSLYRTAGGEARLFVVNHPDRNSSRVEIFAIEDAETLRHLKTVEGAEMISLNDVAAAGPEQFYATNDAGTRTDDTLRPVETFMRLPWASVLYFDGEGLSRVVEGMRYANGVALSPDGDMVYVAETTGRQLTVFDREERTGALTPRAVRMIASGLDNLTVDEDGALWIGAHPKMLDFLAHAEDPTAASPSQVFRATIGETGLRVEEIYLDDGRQLSGSSVAVPVGPSRFLIGSVFERHFLDCRRLP